MGPDRLYLNPKNGLLIALSGKVAKPTKAPLLGGAFPLRGSLYILSWRVNCPLLVGGL